MSSKKIPSQNTQLSNNYNSNSGEIDYEQLAIDVFNEQNRVRTNPESYIEKLERATKFFKDKIFRHPAELPIETYEGIQGVYDAIEFLKNQNPVEKVLMEMVFAKELKNMLSGMEQLLKILIFVINLRKILL